MTGTRKREGFFKTQWNAIAAGAGLLIIIVCAVVFFTNCTGSAGGPADPAVPGTNPGAGSPAGSMPVHAAAYPGTPGELSYGVVMTSGYELADIAVPDKGVFIKILYRGAYAGTWSSGNGTGDIGNSGERLVAIENPGDSLAVDLVKMDNSAKQPFTVEIWKDGTRRAGNSTTLPFGEVTVSTAL